VAAGLVLLVLKHRSACDGSSTTSRFPFSSPPAKTSYYIYQLLRALDYCHSQGIMHRDGECEGALNACD